MSKKEMLQAITKVVKDEQPHIGVMLKWIEKKVIKSKKEQLYYIGEQDVGKSTYYMFLFDLLWEKKDKTLDKQSIECIEFFHNLIATYTKK